MPIESALEAILKVIEKDAREKGLNKVRVPRDFVPCSWCNSRGCAACFNKREQKKAELDAEYKRQFPDGPKPIFTAKIDDAEQMEALKRVFHREKLESAFGPGGRGMEEVLENSEREMAKRNSGENQ